MILRGNPEVDEVDVSSEVNSISFMGSRDQINVRATFGSEPSFAAGNSTYECSIDLNQGVAADDLTMKFFAKMADVDGTIPVSGTFQPGPESATNPRFVGVALVTAFEVGGEVNTEGTHSVKFPLLGRPTLVTVPPV